MARLITSTWEEENEVWASWTLSQCQPVKGMAGAPLLQVCVSERVGLDTEENLRRTQSQQSKEDKQM